MIDWISENLTDLYFKVKKIKHEEEDWFDLEAKIRTQLYSVLTLLFILIVSFILGTLFESIIIILVFNTLRLFVGGVHFEVDNCFKVSVFLIVLFSLLCKYFLMYSDLLLTISVVCSYYILIISPQNIDGFLEEDIRDREYARKQTSICFIVVSITSYLLGFIWGDVMSSAISMGVILVAFSLTKIGKSLLFLMDKILNQTKGRRL